MVRVAVGAKWKTFTPEQQGALTEAFGRYFTATYATRLAQAAGGKFTVKPQSDARGPNRVVQTEVANKDGDTSQVDFLLNPESRVQDVYLNGNVSEVASLRGSFAEPLKTGGVDGLLTFMRDRTTGMLAAKPAP
jgi:phospholipid transport system substrate-binding protein